MRTLSKQEVFLALQYAKSIPESEGAKILNRFQQDQPALCEMLFGSFPQAIALQNRDMAHLFMDMCFDILCVYSRTHGDLPWNIADREWLCNKMALLETEIMSLNKDKQAHKNVGVPMQNRFIAENVQTALLEYLDMAVQDYAAGDAAKEEAVVVVANFLFVITRLFDALYDETPITRH
jgi:hypothetical protein